jgi:hypothetical protein
MSALSLAVRDAVVSRRSQFPVHLRLQSGDLLGGRPVLMDGTVGGDVVGFDDEFGISHHATRRSAS